MLRLLTIYHREVLDRVATTTGTIPAHRAAFKQGYSFSTLPFEQQLLVWDHIWKHSHDFLTRIHPFFFVELFVAKKEQLSAIWHTTVHWQEQVTGWGLCDALAKIYTKALEVYPQEVYAQLALWNTDKDQWKRRQSVVSLLYYSRTKKVFLPFDKIKALLQPLLPDEEYYVQKGIGWTLREMYTVYPAATYPFLLSNIKGISAIAFTIAIEKMEEARKMELKALRRKKL